MLLQDRKIDLIDVICCRDRLIDILYHLQISITLVMLMRIEVFFTVMINFLISFGFVKRAETKLTYLQHHRVTKTIIFLFFTR